MSKTHYVKLFSTSKILYPIIAFSCEKDEFKKGPPPGVPAGEIVDLAPQAAPAPGDASIAGIVVASTESEEPQFTMLLAALEYTGLTGIFTGGEQYTVFAPTDKAFVNLVVALDLTEEENPFAAIDELLSGGAGAATLQTNSTANALPLVEFCLHFFRIAGIGC